MNNDLISRSALLELAHNHIGGIVDCNDIARFPAVDAEPVRHGHWIPQDSTRTKFMCSDCKSRNHDGSGKYCSLCGCKMDAEVE